jgi:phosphate transport system permease protein
MVSLPVLIFNFSSYPYPNKVEIAWSASLVRVLLVFLMNLIGQLFARQQTR